MIDPVESIVVHNSGQMQNLVWKGIASDIDVDKVIGYGYQGLAQIWSDTFTASKILESQSLIDPLIRGDLIAAGYLIDKAPNELFGVVQAEAGKGLALGGRVQSCKYNRYNSVGGVHSKASATVIWQLFDNLTKSIVFEMEGSGSAKGPHDSLNTLAFAVRASFREVLGNPKFGKAVGADVLKQ